MEKELSSKESIALISEMIGRAKKEAAGDGSFQLLLWGWVVALCDFGHFALDKAGYEYPYYVWILIVPAVGWSFLHEFRKQRIARVRTHLDHVLGQLWIGVFMAMVIVLSSMAALNFRHTPVILLLAAVGVFTTGGIIKVNLVRWGGVILALSALLSFNLETSEQYLVGGIAMVLGYLVPGYYLKRNFRERV
jgi:hypothetical protein